MDETSLLFGRDHAFLGEVSTRDGSLNRMILTVEGERRLGSYAEDWQARGIPVLRVVARQDNADGPGVFFQERVPVRQPSFLVALTRWVEGHGMALVSVMGDVLECWELMTRLPLDPKERFALVVTLRGASPSECQTWKAGLEAAVAAAHQEEEKTRKAINALWDRAAKELVAKFKKKG